jgi:hypothetical protein
MRLLGHLLRALGDDVLGDKLLGVLLGIGHDALGFAAASSIMRSEWLRASWMVRSAEPRASPTSRCTSACASVTMRCASFCACVTTGRCRA